MGGGKKDNQEIAFKITAASRKQIPKSKRDDFPKATKRLLQDMAGNMCSYPNCYRITGGAKTDRKAAFSIGVACHIRAASPGGPRYDHTQAVHDRKHFSNGIWMCQTHSKQVDADDSPYSVELLIAWKAQAEMRANQLVNAPIFTEREAKDLAQQESVQLLHRYVGKDTDPIDMPLGEIVSGYAMSLSSLDPRFKVEVDSIGGRLVHKITPIDKSVCVKISIKSSTDSTSFLEAQRALFEEGRPMEVSGGDVSFAGSKLFESISKHGQGGTLRLEGVRKMVEVELLALDDQSEAFICRHKSLSTQGAKRLLIESQYVGGFITSKLVFDVHDAGVNFNMAYNLESWKDKDVTALQYFPRLAKALPLLKKGGLAIDMDFNGSIKRFDFRDKAGTAEFLEQLSMIVDVINKVRKLAELCDAPLIIRSIDDFDELTMRVNKIYPLVCPGRDTESAAKGELLFNGVLTLHDGVAFENLQGREGLSQFQITSEQREVIDVLGCLIEMPRIRKTFNEVEAVFSCPLSGDRSTLNLDLYAGDGATVVIDIVKDDGWRIMR